MEVNDRAVRSEDVRDASILLANVEGVTKVPEDLYIQARDQLADFIAAARHYRRGGK